jgi:hypothetical protein
LLKPGNELELHVDHLHRRLRPSSARYRGPSKRAGTRLA